jgi:RNA polymerase sigma-70 factor (ECF subfamily)
VPSEPGGWVSQHGDALFSYALLRGRRREVAEDLVQETLLAALRAREGFSGRSSERTWLIGILRHKIIDHVRGAARARATGEADLAEETLKGSFDGSGVWKIKLARWSCDPAELFENEEFWDMFHKCVHELPPRLDDAYSLRELEGLEMKEICEILGISASNLAVRLHRARLHLRQCLEARWFTAE